ncbi:MAG: hypothetical protein C9356_15760 [Oleiphilus sp.]|nr:MAG: hypothetical protein C9356_15760 [Oleiphilus sp.]
MHLDKRILFVDDVPEICETFTELFGEHFKIDTANSAEEAIKILESSNDYVLLITDLNMAPKDGWDLIKAAKAIHPRIKTMIQTGDNKFEPIVQAINEALVNGYIIKPWNEYDEIRSNIYALIN